MKTPDFRKPKFELERYRDFIRDAAPFVSIVAGRKLRPADADRLTDEDVRKIAFLIDQRVKDLDAAVEPKK